MTLQSNVSQFLAACTCTGREQTTADLCASCQAMIEAMRPASRTGAPHLSLVRRIESMVDQDAKMGELGPWSTGEKLAVCLVLNRADWLGKMGYSIFEAIDRLGIEWTAAARAVHLRRNSAP